MFRDREEALEALEKQLLEESDEEQIPEESQEEEDIIPEAASVPYDFDAEEDDGDEDLEDLYQTRKKNGLSLWLLILAFLIFAIAYCLAKWEGLL